MTRRDPPRILPVEREPEPRGCLVCGVFEDGHDGQAHAYVDPLRQKRVDYGTSGKRGALAFLGASVAFAVLLYILFTQVLA